MPATRPASAQARPDKTVTKGARLARAFAGFTVAALCLSLTPIQATAAGNSVDPSTYVHSVCTSQTKYTSQIAAIEVSTNPSSATTLTQVRDRLVLFLNRVVAATSSAVTNFQSAGAPNIKNGKTIAALIVKGIAVRRGAFAKAARIAQALNPANAKTFGSGTQAIGKILAAGTTNGVLAGTNKRYNVTPLKAAVSQDPSCQGLRL
jgi:hypothetical protein